MNSNLQSQRGKGELSLLSSLTVKSTFSTETSVSNNTYNNNNIQKIGFIGLGNMGLPMAMNLDRQSSSSGAENAPAAGAGGNSSSSEDDNCNSPSPKFSVVAFDSHEGTRERARDVGGLTISSSIEELVFDHQPSTLIMMVPSDSAVNDIMKVVTNNEEETETRESSSLRLVIDCSTVSPGTSRYWHGQLVSNTSNDILFVDCPVSGGVKGAQDATLTFMAGADTDTVENHVKPILCHMGKRIIACGGPGSGAAVKLCNNLALAAQMVGIAEAMNLGDSLGVDPATLADVLNTSTAKSWSCEVNNPHPDVAKRTGSPASNDYQGGFGTKLMLKDLGLAVQAGKDVDVALPIGTATKELYHLASLRGFGDKDFGVILQFLRGR